MIHFYRPYDEVSPVFLSPFIGADFIVNTRVSLGLRVTFYDVTHNLYGSSFDWIHLVNNPPTAEEVRYGRAFSRLQLRFSARVQGGIEE